MYGAYLSGPGTGKLEYGILDKPKPGKGQVLIKVESVPINPSDLYESFCLDFNSIANFIY